MKKIFMVVKSIQFEDEEKEVCIYGIFDNKEMAETEKKKHVFAFIKELPVNEPVYQEF